jgi:pimeloyl-ACP methyl ester carboxylesterase
VGLAEAVVTGPGFFESLWADWSPGYDASEDVAELRRYVTPDNIADVIAPYRASFNTSPEFADPDAQAEAAASMQPPPVPTLYLHGAADGALGAEILADVETHLPAAGSVFEIVNDVGHFLHLEQPELIAAKITGWLAG